MSSGLVLERRRDGTVAEIVLNRPRRHNALNLAMWQAVSAIGADIQRDSQVRVVVLRAAGARAFSAGADVAEFEHIRASREGGLAYNRALREAMDALVGLPMPVLARIQGFCIGGGCELALCADLRICDEAAEFGIPAAKLGTGLDLGDVQRLVRLVGPAHARVILFSGRRFSAEQALRMGLVDEVVPTADLEACLERWLDDLLAGSPLALRRAKQDIALVLDDPALRNVADRDAHAAELFDSADYREGVRAFLEKRAPRFTGR
ncbi:MAG TPA: enoyl-CoA hydratase-related protein [Chloroflexota bacterium]|jgi:enoyl-CoA hydratase/carnithine racemase|nr:enoyl-CoA hydratase-related protein [Chloroflexota bacterium]